MAAAHIIDYPSNKARTWDRQMLLHASITLEETDGAEKASHGTGWDSWMERSMSWRIQYRGWWACQRRNTR